MVIAGKTQHSKDVNSPKLFYRFNAVLIRIPASFFLKMHTDKIIIQFRWKDKRITKNNFEKKKVEGLSLPKFKMYYIAIIIKTM